MITGTFILTLSLAALIFSVSMGLKNLRLLTWPQINAVIHEKILVRSDKPVGPTPSARWEVKVTYTYSVRGKEYSGEKIWPITEVLNKSTAEKFMDNLAGVMPAYYNPANPTEAYLKRNSLTWAVIVFFLGLAGTIIGLGMILISSEQGTSE